MGWAMGLVKGSDRLVITSPVNPLKLIAFVPLSSYVCSDCPEYKGSSLGSAAFHLLHHLRAQDTSLTYTVHMLCSECDNKSLSTDAHCRHPFEEEPIDLREVILNFVHRYMPTNLTISSMKEPEAPCMYGGVCENDKPAKLHSGSCIIPFTRWIGVEHFKRGATCFENEPPGDTDNWVMGVNFLQRRNACGNNCCLVWSPL